MSREWLHIGKVLSVDAVKRRLRIQASPGFESEFDNRERFWLAAGATAPCCVRATRARHVGAHIIVELTPGVSRDAAAGLKGARVMIPPEARHPRPDGSAALEEMPGLRIETDNGVAVGVVLETLDTAGGGVLRIRLTDGRLAALPATDALIRRVDLAAKVMTIVDPTPFLVVDDDWDGAE